MQPYLLLAHSPDERGKFLKKEDYSISIIN